jgi:hypothetical protein
MIDHYYSILTRKVPRANDRKPLFAAKLTQLTIVVDGQRIDACYPNRECFGDTQGEAIVRAGDALRTWLTSEGSLGNA